MYYYYDVLLNFGSEELYEFYEWKSEDAIDFIKKIPLFRVSTETLKDQLKYKTKFNQDLVEMIKEKTIVKSTTDTFLYACIISDAKNALALELNKEGDVISRSKLLLSDEANLLEMMFTIKESHLEYEKKEKYFRRKNVRQMEEVQKLIECEIETLYQKQNTSKLKYLYYEWFNKTSEDIHGMYEEMKSAIKKGYNTSLVNIYNLIKLSYNKVN